MRWIGFLAVLGGFAGCAPTPEPLGQSQAPVTPLAPPPSTSPAPVADACGAAAAQGLIGRPRSEIPVAADPSRQRVACTTCPITQDYRPERLDIFFDAETGLIKAVRCG